MKRTRLHEERKEERENKSRSCSQTVFGVIEKLRLSSPRCYWPIRMMSRSPPGKPRPLRPTRVHVADMPQASRKKKDDPHSSSLLQRVSWSRRRGKKPMATAAPLFAEWVTMATAEAQEVPGEAGRRPLCPATDGSHAAAVLVPGTPWPSPWPPLSSPFPSPSPSPRDSTWGKGWSPARPRRRHGLFFDILRPSPQ